MKIQDSKLKANPPSPDGYGGTGDTKVYTAKEVVVEGLGNVLKPYDDKGACIESFSALLLKDQQLMQDIEKLAEKELRPIAYEMMFLLTKGYRVQVVKLQIQESADKSFMEAYGVPAEPIEEGA